MQIAFTIFKYFPFGGIQRDLMKLVAECRARGIGVRVYAARWNAPLPDDLDVRVADVAALTNHARYERFAEWVHADLAREPVDVLVGMNKMPGLDVYYAGDSCYQDKAATQRGFWYRLLPRYRSFVAAERAVFDPTADTRILTISKRQIPTFRRFYGTPLERFTALPPGIERDRIAPANAAEVRREFRDEFGIGDDEHLLLFVGSGFVKKGLDRALEALAALPAHLGEKTRLFVLGEDNADPFRRLAQRLGVAQQVRFCGGVSDVPRYLFAAEGLLLPAYDENAGMVILEAMIAGLPALVTGNCGYAHYLGEADAGIVSEEPYDQQRFNTELVALLTSEHRGLWSANGRALSEQDIYSLVPRAVDVIEAVGNQAPIVAFCLFAYFPYGGLQRDFMKVALECVARGLRVRVYAMSWQGPVPEGFEWVPVPQSGMTNHQTTARFSAWVLRHLAERPVDCVVGFNRLPGLDVYYAADSCFEEKARVLRSAGYRFTARYRLFAKFERAVFDAAADTRILAITEAQVAQFQHHYQTPYARFVLMPPGVGLDRKRPQNADELRCSFRREFGFDENDLLLLLIGSGFVTKGVDRALNALAALPPELADRTRMFVIGQDSPKAFQKLASELRIADRVTFFQGRDDVPRFLQGADLMVHPAYLESGGIVLLEAIIAGLPVMASGACGFAPHIEKADAGHVLAEPFVQSELNLALARALENPALLDTWSANGVRYGETADLYGMAQSAVGVIEAQLGEVVNGRA